MKKEYLYFILVPLLPIVLNFIIVKTAFCEVAGNTESWVSFWGSYAGASITAFISFIILKKSIKSNHDENLLARKSASKDTLRRDISERLSHLNVIKFKMNQMALLADKLNVLEEQRKIEYIYQQISDDYASFKILYACKYDEFIANYEKTISPLLNKLSEISFAIGKIPEPDNYNDAVRERLIQTVYDNIKHIIGMKPTIDELWKNATELLNK